MKKFLGFVFAMIISITSVMLGFVCQNKSKESASAAAIYGFSEDSLTNKINIANPVDLNASFLADAKDNESLFKEDNTGLRNGKVVVPKTGEAHNIKSSYDISPIVFSPSDSVYMWIFIPNEHFYDLTIEFSISSTKYIKWHISSIRLGTMLDDAKIADFNYGWRLFEFPMNSADISGEVLNDMSSHTFRRITISYLNNNVYYEEKANNNFQIYHIYKADSFSSDNKILDSQSYVVYKFKNSFLKNGKFIINEEMNFYNIQNMFDYFIVGDNNIYETANSDYMWKIKITDVDKREHEKFIGDKFIFDKYGNYKVEFTLYEYRTRETVAVFYELHTIYVDYFLLGSFTNVDFKFEIGKTTRVTFNLADYFESSNNLVVELDDNSLGTVAYYVEKGVCYIDVTADKTGEGKIVVKCEAADPITKEKKTYTCSTKFSITDPNKKPASEVFLWVILGIYGVGIATFLVISLVKARRTSVK